MDEQDLNVFEQARPRLFGLAYRMLGSRTDAEDVVQECFLKWYAADRSAIKSPIAWLSTVCTRRSLDLHRAHSHTRVDYVGPWLPEPIQTVTPPGTDSDLAASLTTAFLLLLERLTPRERAAYVLREIFDEPYPMIAATLEIEAATCRKLVSRARTHIEQAKPRHVTSAEIQNRLLGAFRAAIASGSTAQLAELLARDIRLTIDSGGKAIAALRVVEGSDVLTLLGQAHNWWAECSWAITDVNAGRGAILTHDEQPVLTLSFAYNAAGQIRDIFMMRNPDKLAHLEPVVVF